MKKYVKTAYGLIGSGLYLTSKLELILNTKLKSQCYSKRFP